MLEFGHNLGIRREVGRLFPYADRWWFPPMAAMLSAAATLSLTVPVGPILVALVALGLSGCGYITFRAAEENAQVGWSEVLNQYQRRCNLVRELVNAVGGAAASEQATIAAVTNALSGVIKIKATADLLYNPWAFVRFVASGHCGSARSSLGANHCGTTEGDTLKQQHAL